MRDATLDRLEMRLSRVLSLLESHLDEELPLERLAGAAALSPFHFHRTWRALTGETVGATVRRLRLERAAHQLATSERPVTDISTAAGFATPQAFAAAFRKTTGSTPSAWRATGAGSTPGGAIPAAVFRVEIVELEPFTIVAHRHVGSYDEGSLATSFGITWAWAHEQGLQSSLAGIWGRPWDDPHALPVDALRYDAGMQFAAPLPALPPHLARIEIPAGTYARVRLHGSYAGLEAIYQYLLGAWLADSGREPADAPLLNHYHNDPESTPVEELVTDVHLLLKA